MWKLGQKFCQVCTYISDSFICDPELTVSITPMKFTHDTAEPFGTGTAKARGKVGNSIQKHKAVCPKSPSINSSW